MPSFPRVRILSTGSEILQGLYADTNAQQLSRILFREGFRVLSHAAAPDDRAQVRDALLRAMEECDLVVMTGGLGPTEDDVNRDVVAELWARELVLDPEADRMMRERFEARGITMPERNVVQAMLPAGCMPLYNHWGTAPGFVLPAEGGRPALVALPGPPSEWCPMLEEALPRVIDPLFPGRPARVVYTLHVAMTPESVINEAVADLFSGDEEAEMTLLAQRGHIRIRLIARGTSEAACRERVDRLREKVLLRIGAPLVFAEGAEETTLAAAVLDLLRTRGETLATAESCTGGWIARDLTDIPGSSDVYTGGWVTYSNDAKTRDLGVPAGLIAQHGAVSEPVARAMAEGARSRAGAHHAVSVTGVAGPGGGTEEKPVGLVWFGVASAGGVLTRRRIFSGDRAAIREWSAKQALELLRRSVLEIDPDVLLMGEKK